MGGRKGEEGGREGKEVGWEGGRETKGNPEKEKKKYNTYKYMYVHTAVVSKLEKSGSPSLPPNTDQTKKRLLLCILFCLYYIVCCILILTKFQKRTVTITP